MGSPIKTGEIVANYVYDSWGKLVTITNADGNDVTDDPAHIGCINPIRYRGYYYDSETGLYYLNARYYDPETGRFISPDDNLEGGLNLFAYCNDNPITYFDPEGLKSIYVIYYTKAIRNLDEQAKHSPYFDSNDAVFLPVNTCQEFIDAWNSLPSNPYNVGEAPIKSVYVYVHGEKGMLCFSDGEIAFSGRYNFEMLKPKKINLIGLFSCNAGNGSPGENVAWEFSRRFNCNVWAVDGHVAFSYHDGKYYTRAAYRNFWQGSRKTFSYTYNSKNKKYEYTEKMGFEKCVLTMVILLTIVSLFLIPNLTRIDDNQSVLVYRHGDKNINVQLTKEESLKVRTIFNYKFLYKDDPACGFGEDVSIIFGEDVFCIACDKCPCIKLLGADKYFGISENDRKSIEKIFEKYGGRFPVL